MWYRPNGTYKKLVPPEGDPATAKVVLIGEAPGKDELPAGRPFVGKAGRLLNSFLEMAGIDRDECYLTNVCKYRPFGNNMTYDMTIASLPGLVDELKGVPTSTPILALGRIARDALCPDASGIGVIAGRRWRTGRTGHQVLSTTHPAFILRNTNQARILFMDLQKVMREPVHVPAPTYYTLSTVRAVQDWVAYMKYVCPLNERPFLAFDIESSGLDFRLHRVLCISFTYEEGKAVIIPDGMLYDSTAVLQLEFKQPWMANNPVIDSLKSLFNLPYRFVAHNSKFDMRFMRGQLGIDNVRCDYDTLLAHYTLWEERGTHGLKELGQAFLDLPDWEHELAPYVGKKKNYSHVPRPILYKYAAWDTEATYQLAIMFERMMKREGLYERPFLFPIMQYVPMLLESELKGFPVDVAHLQRVDAEEVEPALTASYQVLNSIAYPLAERELSPEVEDRLEEYSHVRVMDLSPEEKADRARYRPAQLIRDNGLNPASTQQVAAVIYDYFGMPAVQARTRSRGTKLKSRSTAKETQDKLADHFRSVILRDLALSPGLDTDVRRLFELGPDTDIAKWTRGRTSTGVICLDLIVDWYLTHVQSKTIPKWMTVDAYAFLVEIRNFRRIAKMRSSYITNLIRWAHPSGRAHTTYNIQGTVTGRLSAKEPAIQTIPRDDEKWGKAISDAFVAPPGTWLVYSDFSQCELRIAADVSQDPFLLESYRKDNADIHTDVAIAIYGTNFTQEQRNWYCKRAIYGWLYGGNVFEIARDALRFPEDKAREFATEWDINFAVMAKWRDNAGKDALRTGVVESRLGRRRRFLVITRQNRMEIVHSGQNMPMQSGAADVTLIAAMRLSRKWLHIPEIYLAVTVHDSNIFIVPEVLVPEFAVDMKKTMEDTGSEFYPTVPHQAEVKVGLKWGELHDYNPEEEPWTSIRA